MDFFKWLFPSPPPPLIPPTDPKIIKQKQKQQKLYFTKAATLPSPSDTQISYNYSLTFASKLQPSYTGYIHYVFPGKANEPNITITRPATTTAQYISKDLYIFSKIHDVFDKANGELVLEHTPLANSDKPLYLCFPLITDPTVPNNILYQLTTADESAQNAEIDLSLILPSLDTADLYETSYAHIALIHSYIGVPTNFIGLTRGKIDDLWALPIGPIERIQSANSASTGGLFRPTIIEGLASAAPAPAPAAQPQLYFECDYSDIELQNETPTYMIPVGSDQVTLKEKTLNYAISLVWLLAIVICTVFLAPVCFSIFASMVIPDSVAVENRLEYVNSVESAFSWLFFLPAIVLISLGASKSVKCGDNDTDCIRDSNNLIMPGTILIGIWIFYVLSIAWFKYSSPDFLGFRDRNKTDPYYRYTKDDLYPQFNPISGVMGIFRVLFFMTKPG